MLMRKLLTISAAIMAALSSLIISSCAGGGSTVASHASGNLGPAPDPAIRKAQIAAEPRGNFYYGRRYFVDKTRFWGYLRKPGQSWQKAKLVLMHEGYTTVPDRKPEKGPKGARYAYDQNYEYRISGNYTGTKGYDPNSNSILPIFKPTNFTLLNKKPGWLFSPNDYYNAKRITLRPR